MIEKDLLMNFDYLNRVFKKSTGLTIFEYLKNTNHHIYEIASNYGFSS